jgi:hypothetical protein
LKEKFEFLPIELTNKIFDYILLNFGGLEMGLFLKN